MIFKAAAMGQSPLNPMALFLLGLLHHIILKTPIQIHGKQIGISYLCKFLWYMSSSTLWILKEAIKMHKSLSKEFFKLEY